MRDDRGHIVTSGPGWSREVLTIAAVSLVIGFIAGIGAVLSVAAAGDLLFFVGLAVIIGVFIFATDMAFARSGGPPPPSDECRACGFHLGGLHQAQDGCTVCPECGHAWRLAATEAETPR